MAMGETKQICGGRALQDQEDGSTVAKRHVSWSPLMEAAGNVTCEESSDSIESFSSSSEDVVDDDSSSSSCSRSPSYSPLYELSELMSQLPIKRGLSKFYHGKSESFASLASVKSIEELAKKESSYNTRMKSCKSYGAGLNGHHHKYRPKPTITKKASKGSFSPFLANRYTLMSSSSCRPSVSLQKNF